MYLLPKRGVRSGIVAFLLLIGLSYAAIQPVLASPDPGNGRFDPAWLSIFRRESEPPVQPAPIADQIRLTGIRHDYQRWNNCAPTTTRMTLSYFGIDIPQATIAEALKPDPQDANVSPAEIVPYVQGKGLRAVVRVNGGLETVMQLLSNRVPVIVEQWIEEKGGMGHYRLVSAYDRPRQVFVTQDSYFGPNYRLSFADFDRGWAVFNRLYIPVYTAEQEPLVKAILGPDFDDAAMVRRALETAQTRIQADSKDPYGWYALGDAHLAQGNAPAAAEAYETAIAIGLPWRFFWYQFGPFEALLQVGDYQRVLALTAPVLKKMPNIEELHLYRGEAFRGLGDTGRARAEFELALKYHPGYERAQAALRK